MRTDVILLVDDNPDDVYLTMHAFRKNGIDNEIIVAHDGMEAMDLLAPVDGSPPLHPTIILLDLNMPRMGGLELLARLRAGALTKSLPVIVLTTSDQERDIAESYDLGVNSYVQKPVTPNGFLEAAKALGVYWLEINKQVRAV